MKTIFLISILFVCVEIHGQVMFNVDTPFPKKEVLKVKRFNDLQETEQKLLIEDLKNTYFTFNKKEIEYITLLFFMREQNFKCEWYGLFFEKEGKFVALYKIEPKVITKIFLL